jgi:capsular polysaccharide transport system ATP-binding protein
MLIFDRVSKSYRSNGITKKILSDFSFEFPANRNLGIMGRNGAGKSTLMRLIAGTEPPDRGQIYRTSRISWPLGFSGGFNGSMTGIENIKFVSRIYGQNPSLVIESVDKFAQLGASLRLPIKTYSSGMKARLAFGLSMAMEFDVYLIDETTAVGDGNFKKRSKQMFQKKLSKSKIIMISHSISTIKNYCDCGILMHNGEISYFDDTKSLLKAYSKINK